MPPRAGLIPRAQDREAIARRVFRRYQLHELWRIVGARAFARVFFVGARPQVAWDAARAGLHQSLERGIAQADAGALVDADEALADLAEPR